MLEGAELVGWRKRYGLTQSDLAQEVGVTLNTIIRWEMERTVAGSRRPTRLTRPLLDRAIRRLEGKEPAVAA